MNISLSDLRDQAERLKLLLTNAQEQREPDERYRGFLGEQVQLLFDSLRDAATPETYRVAVVGSFKVGKSSFVNALCDVTRLVSVATNPETAAVTVLRYSSNAYANIHMISQQDWQRMRDTYDADPGHPAATRYADLRKKEQAGELKEAASADGKERKAVNLADLEKRYLADTGQLQRVECVDWSSGKEQIAFSKALGTFTSQSSPAHFFVDRLEVFVPVDFLRDGIELIDTPGLNDPDRYRVHITEQLVEDVDVILFLTQSGRSYSQQDKDFITTQLRKGTLKHLMVIVTHCDETFDKAVRDAEEVGDAPPSFSEHLQLEEQRLRQQIKATLDELLSDPQLRDDLGEYYLEKLLDIKVNFTSAHYYRDGKKEGSREKLDRSGIEQLRRDLAIMLAQSERITRSKNILADAINRVGDRVTRTFTARRSSISTDFNIERVRTQLSEIDAALNTKLSEFEQVVDQQVRLLQGKNAGDHELVRSQITIAVLSADSLVSDEFKSPDLARHWRTRRNHGWGNLDDMQNRIANRIFPQVESFLRRYTAHFGVVLDHVRIDLNQLQDDVRRIEQQSGLDQTLQPLQLTSVFDATYQQQLRLLEEYISAQKDTIIGRLDSFVSEEMEDEIDAARDRVAVVLGRGTTGRQNEHIDRFYDYLRNELKKALTGFLNNAVDAFASTLEQKAATIYPELKRDLDRTIDDHRRAIESSLSERNEQQKQVLLAYLQDVLKEADHLFQGYS